MSRGQAWGVCAQRVRLCFTACPHLHLLPKTPLQFIWCPPLRRRDQLSMMFAHADLRIEVRRIHTLPPFSQKANKDSGPPLRGQWSSVNSRIGRPKRAGKLQPPDCSGQLWPPTEREGVGSPGPRLQPADCSRQILSPTERGS